MKAAPNGERHLDKERVITPKVYTTSHYMSREICAILARGFDGQQVPPITLLPGLAITYGILRGTGDILRQADATGHPYIYCDHSYFAQYRRDRIGKIEAYYRLVSNGRYAVHPRHESDGNRFTKLSLEIRPWRTNGRHIVVVPMSGFVGDLIGANPRHWLATTLERLSSVTNREIIIKPKDNDQDFEDVITDAWAVIAHDSMAAVDAARLGIPVFTSAENAAAPVANFDLTDIENPALPDREQWLYSLANQQFTLKEIENGSARQFLGV